MALDFVTNQEIIMAARRNLAQNVWHYLTGGAESETTMRRNRFGLDSLAFRPRVLVDVSKIDTSTTVLGHKLRIPVMLAPIGSLQSITPEGGVAVAKAAEEFGTVNFVSSVTQPSLEQIAAASRSPKIFQLYVQGDLKWVETLLSRVKQAGYSALCLTVDTAHYGHRERQMMDRWLPPSRRGVGYEYRASLTWETLDAIREMAGLPFILKGVATAEDAVLAVEHGASTIYVSNHGGRQLDHGRATYRNAAGDCRCGARQSGDLTRRWHRSRQRRAQGDRSGCARRRHRQASGLGTRRRRSSGTATSSRNTRK
jgi:isopentenyl diphosphate isomerase/L-lactate dehydrogenase-like FMN-dependent dehydrogenase